MASAGVRVSDYWDLRSGEPGRAPHLADLLGEAARVDAVEGGDAGLLEPVGEGAGGGPVGVLEGVGGDDEAGDVNLVGLKVLGEAVLVNDGVVRHAVVSHEGKGED